MTIADTVLAKKIKLNDLKLRIRPDALDSLDNVQKIFITYTSNALEGNTLTAGETALVIEKGITVNGKPMNDHNEAVDHAYALEMIVELAALGRIPIVEADIRNIHQMAVAKSKPHIAGRYANSPRFVITSDGPYHFPSHIDVPRLMGEFAEWLGKAGHSAEVAFAAHRQLVGIHPFNDGNGRTARLLMNLILMRDNYPAIAIRPEVKPAYLEALELGSKTGDHTKFEAIMYASLDATLDQYILAATEAAAGMDIEPDTSAPKIS